MQQKDYEHSIDELIESYLKGNISDTQKEELLAWIKKDSANKLYFDQMAEIWVTTKAMGNKTEYNYQKAFDKFKKQINSNYRPVVFNINILLKIAAVFIIAFSTGGIWFYQLGKNHPVSNYSGNNEIIVPRGGKARFVLSDGTIVTLNAESKLCYSNRYGEKNREVLLEGEGYFDVAKDKERPFVVKTSHIKVCALGTEFNVKAYPSEKTIETTLVEGSVKIENTESGQIILKPNQKLVYYKDKAAMVEESDDSHRNRRSGSFTEKTSVIPSIRGLLSDNINVAGSISWKENKWIIERMTLSKLAVEMERKFDIHIHFESDQLKEFRFTGTLFDESLEQVLQVMSFSAPINYKIKGKEVIFSEKENFEQIRKLYKDK